jgi:hypothetical protein
METTEKIVEAYVRYVRGWATIPNVRCDGQFEIDLYGYRSRHNETLSHRTSVSGSPGFSKLTAKDFDPALLKERVQKPKCAERSVTSSPTNSNRPPSWKS